MLQYGIAASFNQQTRSCRDFNFILTVNYKNFTVGGHFFSILSAAAYLCAS
jgi:hypothetical protein